MTIEKIIEFLISGYIKKVFGDNFNIEIAQGKYTYEVHISFDKAVIEELFLKYVTGRKKSLKIIEDFLKNYKI